MRCSFSQSCSQSTPAFRLFYCTINQKLCRVNNHAVEIVSKKLQSIYRGSLWLYLWKLLCNEMFVHVRWNLQMQYFQVHNVFMIYGIILQNGWVLGGWGQPILTCLASFIAWNWSHLMVTGAPVCCQMSGPAHCDTVCHDHISRKDTTT